MGNVWYVEKVTICFGCAIIYLGLNTMFGYSETSPALVTGISLSGFCLTLADFLNKIYNNPSNKKLASSLHYIDFLLYILAAMCIVGYPNVKFITSLGEETLNKMSTVASVVALGFVFITIGFGNIKNIIEEKKKKDEQMDKLLDFVENNSNKNKELDEKTSKLMNDMSTVIEKQSKTIEELQNKIQKLENIKSPI
jgi:hypothetical protein